MKFKVKESIPSNVIKLNGLNGNAYSTSKYLYKQIVRENVKYNYEGVILSEGVDYTFDPKNLGGTIVFSTDVNAIEASKNKIVNWVKQKVATLNNRLHAVNRIDRIAQKYDLAGWTVGKGLSGRYTAKNGKVFGENSISVDIIGISTETLLEIATELCNLFNQEAVLVKDYTNNDIYLVNGN